MKDLNQLIFEFKLGKKILQIKIFMYQKVIKHVYDLINMWPNWEKKVFEYLGRKFFRAKHI